MDLIQLKHYLHARKIVPLQDMALHFKVEVETIRPLLEVWINKGKVGKRAGVAGACRGCCKCNPAAIEIYQWLE